MERERMKRREQKSKRREEWKGRKGRGDEKNSNILKRWDETSTWY
jgi:hypothetical protein